MKFEEVYAINVNDFTEKRKQRSTEITYLSWTYAVKEFKKIYPDMTYEIKKFKNEMDVEVPYMFDKNTGYMVMTSVTAGGITHEMWLPVMDSSNKAMKSEEYTYTVKDYHTKQDVKKTVAPATMFDINKTIMRCLTKNLAMFGLGLYIYAGEDLPEKEPETRPELSEECKQQIKDCKTVDELTAFYKKAKNGIPAELNAEFLSLLSARKSELEKNVKNN